MWKYGFLTLFLLFCLCLSATEKKDFEKAVCEAVSWQMQTYPKSTLKDGVYRRDRGADWVGR